MPRRHGPRGSAPSGQTIASEPTPGRGPQRQGRAGALSMLSTAMAQGLQRGRRRRRGPRGRGGQGISDVSQDLTQAAMNPQRGPGGIR